MIPHKNIIKLTFLSLIIFPLFVFSQNYSSITYNFIYHYDTTNQNKIEQEVMELDFSTNESRFFSRDHEELDATIKTETQRLDKEGKTFTDFALIGRILNMNGEIFFTDLASSTVYEQKTFENQTYLLKNNSSIIDWKIQDSTKMIANYTCQKAIGVSSGRTYIVWFTTDLPYGFGPRRLFGLPGLILEASDDHERISYRFKSVLSNTVKTRLLPPSNAITADYKDYNKMVAASMSMYHTGYKKTETTTVPDANGKMHSVTTITSGGTPSKKTNPYNFPLDVDLK